MRCKQCGKEILGLGKPVVAPVIVAFLVLGGGVFAQSLGRLTFGGRYLDGWVLALASLVAAAVLVWRGLTRRMCPGCGSTKMFDVEGEEAVVTYERLSSRKTDSAGQRAEMESELRTEIAQRVRSEIETELRSEIAAEAEETRAALEKDLRATIEKDLRPRLIRELQGGSHDQELRKKLEEELRPEIERKLRSTVEAELLPSLERALRLEYHNALRPELEKELRSQIEEKLRPEMEKRLRTESESRRGETIDHALPRKREEPAELRGKPASESAPKPSGDGGKPASQEKAPAKGLKAPPPQLTPPLSFIHPAAGRPIPEPPTIVAPQAATKGAKSPETAAAPSAAGTKPRWSSPLQHAPAARPISGPAAKAPLATGPQAATKSATPPPVSPAVATEAGSPATLAAAAKDVIPLTPISADAATGVHERAQRRARVIVSDLALYDKETLVKAAHAADSRKELGGLWKDAVRSYKQAVPPAVCSTTDYLGEELDRCLAKLRQA